MKKWNAVRELFYFEHAGALQTELILKLIILQICPLIVMCCFSNAVGIVAPLQ